MLTPQEQEWRDLAEKATPGPWTWEDGPATLYSGRGPFHDLLGRLEPDWNGQNNLDFIAAARSAVPALLAEVERLRALLPPT